MAQKKSPPQNPTTTPVWEWIVAALGAVMIAAAIGYFVWYGLTKPEGPPELQIRRIDTVQIPGGFLVHVAVRNSGPSTAANVELQGSLSENGESLEESNVTLDYVPQQSEREAYLQFDRDPQGFELRLRVLGMAKP